MSKKDDELLQDKEQELDNEQVEQPEVEAPVEEELAPEEPSLEQQLADLQDSFLRTRAEYDNYRKRTQKEKSDLLKYGGERVVLAFLEIIDDFDLALQNLEQAESKEGIVEGIELIYNKFIATLKAQKVAEMEVIGQDFDAEIHDAVAMIPTEDKSQKGKVIDCVQKGYQLDDKVIRHPKVVVGQ